MRVWHFTKAAMLTSLSCLASLLAGCPALSSQDPGVSGDQDRIQSAPQGEAEESRILVDIDPYRISGVASIAFSPDGEKLAIGSAIGALHLFKVASGEELLRLPGRRPLIMRLSYPDARTVIGMSSDGEIHVWDVVERRTVKRIAAHVEWRSDLGALAAKSRIVLRTQPKPALIEIDTERTIAEYSFRDVTGTALSNDGHVGAIAADGSIAIVRSSRDSKADWLEGVRSRVRAMSFSPDARWLAASTEDRVAIWSVDGETMGVAMDAGKREIWCLAWTPDQRWLVGGANGGEIIVWESVTGKSIAIRKLHSKLLGEIAVSPDSRMIASASGFEIVLWRPWTQFEREYGERQAPLSLETAWDELGAAEASVAYRAMPALIARPAEAIPLIREMLIQDPPSQERIEALIDALDDDDPNVRESAMRELADMGNWVKKVLGPALSDSTPPEQAGRIRALQEDRPRLRCDSPDLLRKARAIQVLEVIGTEASREVLRELVGSPCPVFLSDMAQAALRRLTSGRPGGR
jgi:hypothetical protein